MTCSPPLRVSKQPVDCVSLLRRRQSRTSDNRIARVALVKAQQQHRVRIAPALLERDPSAGGGVSHSRRRLTTSAVAVSQRASSSIATGRWESSSGSTHRGGCLLTMFPDRFTAGVMCQPPAMPSLRTATDIPAVSGPTNCSSSSRRDCFRFQCPITIAKALAPREWAIYIIHVTVPLRALLVHDRGHWHQPDHGQVSSGPGQQPATIQSHLPHFG